MRILTPARVTVLMLLVVGGLIAAYVAKNLLAAETTPTKIETRAVPMAISDLRAGTVVTVAHIGLGRMPVQEIAKHPGMLLENRAIVGRIVKQNILAGTPILSGQLYQPGEQPPLDVEKGMRAVSVSLKNAVALVDGRIGPGQYVDVHLTPNSNGTNDARVRGGITLTLFKGVRVLALNAGGNTSLGSGASAVSVTLELSPGQANIMILASTRGDITLSYNPEGRSDGGVGVNNADRATLDEILGLAKPADNGTFTTESFKGTSRTQLQFQNGRRIENTGVNSPPQRSTSTGGPSPLPNTSRRQFAKGPRLSPSA